MLTEVMGLSSSQKNGEQMKERITVTLNKEILDWIDRKVNDRTFANRSHGFEFLIQRKVDHEMMDDKD